MAREGRAQRAAATHASFNDYFRRWMRCEPGAGRRQALMISFYFEVRHHAATFSPRHMIPSVASAGRQMKCRHACRLRQQYHSLAFPVGALSTVLQSLLAPRIVPAARLRQYRRRTYAAARCARRSITTIFTA